MRCLRAAPGLTTIAPDAKRADASLQGCADPVGLPPVLLEQPVDPTRDLETRKG